MKSPIVFASYVAGFAAVAATPAHAYIGPGGGLTAVGALLALFAAVVVIFFGFLWYPIKRMRKARRERKAGGPPPPAADTHSAKR